MKYDKKYIDFKIKKNGQLYVENFRHVQSLLSFHVFYRRNLGGWNLCAFQLLFRRMKPFLTLNKDMCLYFRRAYKYAHITRMYIKKYMEGFKEMEELPKWKDFLRGELRK